MTQQSQHIDRHKPTQQMCEECHKRPAVAMVWSKSQIKRQMKIVKLSDHTLCIRCFNSLTEQGGRR